MFTIELYIKSEKYGHIKLDYLLKNRSSFTSSDTYPSTREWIWQIHNREYTIRHKIRRNWKNQAKQVRYLAALSTVSGLLINS